jgi:hypothetical protein
MKKIALVICCFALLGACGSSKVKINKGPATVQTASRSEPIFYNGKTYQLDYNYIEGQGAFDRPEFPDHPLYNGSTWFLPFVGRYFRARDWIDRKLG